MGNLTLMDYLVTDLVKVADDPTVAAALTYTADDAITGTGSGNVDFLNFSGKTGRYSLGRNKDEIDPDQNYIVEPQMFVGGWVCWKESKVLERIEWNALDAKTHAVPEADLDDHGPYRENAGEGWKQMLGFGALAMDGMVSQIKFTTTSSSGLNVVGDFMHEIGARAAVAEPSLPIVRFGETTFNHMSQTNYKPVIAVEAWARRASVKAYFEGILTADELLDGIVKPKRKSRAKKK